MSQELGLVIVRLETPKYGQTETWAKLHLWVGFPYESEHQIGTCG